MKKFRIVGGVVVIGLVITVLVNLDSYVYRDIATMVCGLCLGFSIRIITSAFYRGKPMEPALLPRNKLFQVRAEYHNAAGTYLLVDFGDKKIITVFFPNYFPEVKVGYYYTYTGKWIESDKK